MDRTVTIHFRSGAIIDVEFKNDALNPFEKGFESFHSTGKPTGEKYGLGVHGQDIWIAWNEVSAMMIK